MTGKQKKFNNSGSEAASGINREKQPVNASEQSAEFSTCPRCQQKSLFLDPDTGEFACLNTQCGIVETEDKT
jgi:hypothetical protein